MLARGKRTCGRFLTAVPRWAYFWPAARGVGRVLGGPLPVLVGEPEVRPELGTGEPAAPEMLPSAVGLVWRALIIWMLLIL